VILPDDDEIYNVDQTYLGPPGYHVGRFRYRSLVVGPALFAVGLAFVANTVGYSLLAVGLLVLAVGWVTSKAVDRTSAERPLGTLLAVVVHETNAPRESTRSCRSGSLNVRIRLERPAVSTGCRRSFRSPHIGAAALAQVHDRGATDSMAPENPGAPCGDQPDDAPGPGDMSRKEES